MNRGQSSLVCTFALAVHARLNPVIILAIAYGNSIICLDSRKYGEIQCHHAIATIDIANKHYSILCAVVISLTIPYKWYSVCTDHFYHLGLWNSRIEVDSHVDLCTIATIYISFNIGECTFRWIGDTIRCIRQLASTDSYNLVNYLQSRSSHIEGEISCLYITAGILDGEGHGVGSSATCDSSSGPLYLDYISQFLGILCQVERLDSISRNCHIRGSTRSQYRSCTSDGIQDSLGHGARSHQWFSNICINHIQHVRYMHSIILH